jgi:hypothetical protein
LTPHSAQPRFASLRHPLPQGERGLNLRRDHKNPSPLVGEGGTYRQRRWEGGGVKLSKGKNNKNRRGGEGPRPVRGEPGTREPAQARGSARVAARSGPFPQPRLLFLQRQPAERAYLLRRLERRYAQLHLNSRSCFVLDRVETRVKMSTVQRFQGGAGASLGWRRPSAPIKEFLPIGQSLCG